ncbi:MAG: pitrilysin family protein [Pseudomonadota bacterium]
MSGALTVLPNGVRVWTEPMPALASAAIGVWVRAGAMDERREENGVAHLLEHMAFKGASRRDARAIAEDVEAVGGYLNAATSYPHTGYYARVLKDDAPLAFDILADIVRAPTLAARDLDTEKDVVIQEIGEARDTPDDLLFENLQAATFEGQALGRPILGEAGQVATYMPDDLRAFVARHYRPAHVVVAAAGAVDPAEILDLAARYFGDMADAADAEASDRSFRIVGGVRHVPRDLEQTHVAFSAPGAGLTAPDYVAARVFTEILGGGMASRLFQNIREKRGLAYSVYAFADAYDAVGASGFYLGVEPGRGAEALRLSLDEIAAIARDVLPAEVDRARAMFRASLLMGLENPMGRAERAAGDLFTHGRVRDPAAIEASLAEVTPEAVSAFAERLLQAPGRALSVVGPADFATMRSVIS